MYEAIKIDLSKTLKEGGPKHVDGVDTALPLNPEKLGESVCVRNFSGKATQPMTSIE